MAKVELLFKRSMDMKINNAISKLEEKICNMRSCSSEFQQAGNKNSNGRKSIEISHQPSLPGRSSSNSLINKGSGNCNVWTTSVQSVNKLNNSVKELEEVVGSGESASTVKGKNCNETTKIGKSKDFYKNCLVIKARDGTTNSDNILLEIKKSVNPVELSIPVNKIKKINAGVVINCESSESLSLLQQKLIQSLPADNYEMSTMKKMYPKIVIYGVDKKDMPQDDNELEENIIMQNKISRDVENFMFKIVRKFDSGLSTNIVVMVDCCTRKYVFQKNGLFVGWLKCNVKDSFHVKRCNKCASYGHLQNDCKSNPVCLLCAEGHDFKVCTSENLKCANCIRHNKMYKLNLDIKHASNSKDCPCYLKIIEDIKAKTDYGE